MNKLLLEGYYGVHNLGDDFILLSLMDLFSDINDLSVVCITNGDKYCDFKELYKGRVSVDFVEENKRDNPIKKIIKKARLLKKMDYWIIGGGGLYTSESFPTFAKLYALIKIAKIFGTRVAFYGIEINSINKGFSKKIWKSIANNVDFIFTRNDETAAMLNQLNSNNKKIKNYWDLTFALNTESEKGGQNDFQLIDKPYFIWSLAMPWNQKELQDSKYQTRYEKLINQIADVCNMHPEIIHVFVPFFEETDNKFIFDVVKKLNVGYKTCNNIPRYERRLLFKNACLAICMRFHSVLFSIYNENPFVAISYAPKTTRILNECGFNDNYVEFGVRDSQFFYNEFDLKDDCLQELVEKGLTQRKYDSQKLKEEATMGRSYVSRWLRGSNTWLRQKIL